MTENIQKTSSSWVKYICHQRPDRCFKINGKPMNICSRCLGVYLGLLIGLLVPFIIMGIYLISVTTLLFLMLIGIVPMGIDGLTQFLGFRQSNNYLRFITGFIAGLFIGILFNWLAIHVLVLD